MKKIIDLSNFVQGLLSVFTKPSGELFLHVLEGWILCPCRRFVTSIFSFGDPDSLHKHDSYHRFFRASAWVTEEFFHALAKFVISFLATDNIINLIGDDTVHKKTGTEVAGAKSCRDAVRSTTSKIAFVWGLQIILLCVCFRSPWGGEPLALPINLRLYRKRIDKTVDPSLLDLMMEMLDEVVSWFPERSFRFTVDGFYASLVGRLPFRVHMITRIRSDAALYTMPYQPKKKSRGRPRIKGTRLPTPLEMANQANDKDWRKVLVNERRGMKERLIISRRVVWHSVKPGHYVLLVISRDPEGIEHDDFFITSDCSISPEVVISNFSNRWAIEDTFRNAKQYLGIEQPQSWKGEGPLKIAAMGYMVYSVVWLWFIKYGDHYHFPSRPWYLSKRTPSFQDALADIRQKIWNARLFETMDPEPEVQKIFSILVESLARAA